MFRPTFTRILAPRLHMALALSGVCLLPVMRTQAQSTPVSPNAPTTLSVHDESLLANAPFDNPDAMRGALMRGARVDARDAQGRTALILAAGYNPDAFLRTYERVKSLQASSGIVPQTGLGYSGNRLTLSLRDAQGLQSEAAQYLLGLGAKQQTDAQTGRTVLTWDALNNGNTATLQILLDAGANINARARDGKTALIAAIQNDNPAATRLLLDRGIDFNLADNTGLTALGYAANRGNATLVQALQAKGATADARSPNGAALLRFAIGQGNIAQVRELLQQGANIAESPLYIAERGNNVEMVRLLIEHGASVNKRDFFGGTPLAEALNSHAEDTAKLLLEKGADPNGTDGFHRSSLFIASANGSPEIVGVLLDKGADPNIRDDSGATPLHEAMWGILRGGRRSNAPVALSPGKNQNPDTLAVVTLLLDKGADINARTKEGATPLLNALAWGQSDVARLLIQRGADVNLKNKQGDSPLRRALALRLNDVVELLRTAGAKE